MDGPPRAARVVSARPTLLTRPRRLWAYPDLVVRMTRTELEVTYGNGVLGFEWSMLNVRADGSGRGTRAHIRRDRASVQAPNARVRMPEAEAA